ncbi:MAG: hypothetical protein LBP51_06250 [Deferribacteraceae bacterium]|jgi:hypothetical protein|nr:hypothetical protein [Deferribacteraceae bacterium]
MKQAVIARFFDAVKPMRAAGRKKVRIGGNSDGAYVMLEPKRGGIAYSIGVGDVVRWDVEMSELGYQVFQYDGTLDSPPIVDHPLIKFHGYNIFAEKLKSNERTLSEIINENVHADEVGMILQMDIETAEWELFEKLDEHILQQFEQILVEFHNISPKSKDFIQQIEVFEKLNKTHQVIHIHGNNLGDLHFVWRGGVRSIACLSCIPASLEITYVRRDDSINFIPEDSFFPTELDRANNPRRPDMVLGYWGEYNDTLFAKENLKKCKSYLFFLIRWILKPLLNLRHRKQKKFSR